MLKKIFKFISDNKILIIIVLFAALLRLYGISNNPPSLNWDEVSHGYNAYSILKTGKDEWGETLPIIFRAYGDYKLPSYIYLTAVSELFFGVTSFAVRLPSVIAGILSVVFTYLLVLELFKDKKNYPFSVRQLALISAFLVAVEPWSLFISRGAFEANLALTFTVLGMYLFLKGINRSAGFFLPASLMFGLCVWTYNSARVFIPIFIALLIFIYRKDLGTSTKRNKKTITYSILLTFLFLLPMFWQLFSSSGRARYTWVSILDEGAISRINEARFGSKLNPGLNRLINNKVTYFSKQFIRNWISHYSADYIFLEGGSDYQFNVQGKGLIYPINAVFLIIGVVVLLKRRNKESLLLLGWFYLGSVASSLTRGSPHVLRSITMLPSPMVLSALGFLVTSSYFQKKFSINHIPLTFLYILLIAISLRSYLNVYFHEYRNNYSWSWQYGYKEMVSYVKDNYQKYDKIIITKKYGEPHEFLLFYWQWDPSRFQNDKSLVRFYQSKWYWVDKFDKFWFVNDWEVPGEEWEYFMLESGEQFNCEGQSCLLITSPGNVPKKWQKIETIDFLDTKPAFEIYEN